MARDELGGASLHAQLAAAEHIGAIGDLEDGPRALLDDQHRGAGVRQTAHVLLEHDVAIMGARLAVGSSRTTRAGSSISARPIASILRSPPLSLPARRPSIRPSCGKDRQDVVDPRRDLAALEQVTTHLKVLAHGERRENVVDLWHIADADPRDVLVGHPVTSWSPTRTVPDRISTSPTTPLSSVLLPDPFGPTIDTTSPGATVIETPWTTGLPS